MDDPTDLADEWLLTPGTVSDEIRTACARSVRQFNAWLADQHLGRTAAPLGSGGTVVDRRDAAAGSGQRACTRGSLAVGDLPYRRRAPV